MGIFKSLPEWVFIAVIIVLVFVIGSIFCKTIVIFNDLNKISGEISNLIKDISKNRLKTYKNEALGFEVKYPANIFQLDSANAILKHTLKNFHKYSLKDGSDLGLADDIKIVFKKDTKYCDEIEVSLEGVGVPFEIGNLKGIKYGMGAEGEGVVDYCVQDSQGKNIFLIERFFLLEAWSIELPNQPDYFSPAKQEELFNQIISNFRFIKETGFCGTSTYGNCNSNSDCMTGGCSGQVCQSKNEEPIITTCEYRDCYNASAYDVKCECLNNKCQWTK